MSSAGLRAINFIFKLFETDSESQDAKKRILHGDAKFSHFKLLCPSPRVLQVLKMASYGLYLDICDNLKEAIEAF